MNCDQVTHSMATMNGWKTCPFCNNVLPHSEPRKVRQPLSEEKIGAKFSPAFSNLRCTGNFTRMQVYQDYHSDIMTIWECEETGNKFAFYVNSGIRQITERLYQDQLNYFFAHGNVI